MFGLGLLQTSAIAFCLLIGTSGGAYVWGYERGQRQAIIEMQAASVKAIAKAVEEARALQIAEDAITNEIGKHEAEARERIVTRVLTQVRQVPINVPKSSDDACQLRAGFVRLHDAAARGDNPANAIPGSSGSAVDTPASTRLSDVASTVVVNYGKYYQVANELIQLQSWVKKEITIHDKMPN